MSAGGMLAQHPASISPPHVRTSSSPLIISAEALMVPCWNKTRPQSAQTIRIPSRRAQSVQSGFPQTAHLTILSDECPQTPQTVAFLRDLVWRFCFIVPPFVLK